MDFREKGAPFPAIEARNDDLRGRGFDSRSAWGSSGPRDRSRHQYRPSSGSKLVPRLAHKGSSVAIHVHGSLRPCQHPRKEEYLVIVARSESNGR
ncbi:hypothetical protein KM043_009252 [Ampulex compressa]|nr:hypothetical protein KM043_009252 [Ampulex compressa]